MKNKLFKSVALGSLTVMLFSNALPIKSALASSSSNTNVSRPKKDTKTTEQVHITPDNFTKYFSLNGNIHGNPGYIPKYEEDQGIVTLTEDRAYLQGYVTLKKYIDFSQDFTLIGSINIGNKSQLMGADGIGFGFRPNNSTDVGKPGGALGFGGLDQAFGWKADTWWNNGVLASDGPFEADPAEFKGHSDNMNDGQGGGVAFGSFVYTNTQKYAISYDQPDSPAQQIAEPKDNQFLPFTLTYTGKSKTLTVNYNGQNWSKDVSSWIGDNLNETFFITASTGFYTNLQQVKIDDLSYTSKDSQANLTGDDVTIHVGDSIPKIEQFNPKATDKDGNPVDIANISVDTSKVDNKTAGDYDAILSSPDDQQKTVQVHVLDNTKINAHDTTITQGDTWSPADSFDSATDDHGQNIPLNDITVSGADKVDINTPGAYQVTYTTKDGTHKTITVTVTAKPVTPPTNDEKGTINAHDSEIDKGAKFDAQDNFDSATNANGAKVDWDQIKVTGADQVDTNKPGDYQVTYSFTDSNGHLISKTVTVTVNDSDDVNNGDGNATQPNGGKPFKVYAKTSINEYSSDTFTAKGKKKHYAAKNRVYAPIFTVKKVVTNKNGRDRYLLDNGRYITANTANVNYLYWQGDSYKQLYVIHPTGTYEYKSATFAKKNRVKLHHQGEVLKVKKVIHHGLTTRYQLTNGNYVSGNKQWTSPNKWSFPKRVKAVGAINVYKTANLTGKVKHYKAKSHQVFTVKGFDYSHGFENRGYTKRYKVSGGYISANPKIVKEVK